MIATAIARDFAHAVEVAGAGRYVRLYLPDEDGAELARRRLKSRLQAKRSLVEVLVGRPPPREPQQTDLAVDLAAAPEGHLGPRLPAPCSKLVPPIVCPGCACDAACVMVAPGYDVHECGSCGAYVLRWRCCGHVELAPPATRTHRERRCCPGCRRDRFPEPPRPRAHAGAIPNAEGQRANGEVLSALVELVLAGEQLHVDAGTQAEVMGRVRAWLEASLDGGNP